LVSLEVLEFISFHQSGEKLPKLNWLMDNGINTVRLWDQILQQKNDDELYNRG